MPATFLRAALTPKSFVYGVRVLCKTSLTIFSVLMQLCTFFLYFPETSMQRCLILLREFSCNNVLIHTGLHLEFGPNHQTRYQDKSSSSSSAEPVEVPLVDKLALEGVEASQLCK